MADTFRLRYGFTAKPVLADRDGEAVVNWSSNGNHTITASATHVWSGSKSFKVAASGTGDFTTNYIGLAVGNNATFIVARKYAVGIHGYAATGNTAVQVQTGGVTVAQIVFPTTTWSYQVFEFTAVAASAEFRLSVTNGGGGDFYFEMEPVSETVGLPVLSERGMSDPDSFDFFPQIQKTFLDGSMKDYVKGFRRKIRVDVGVVASAADRKQILYWMIDNNRTVDYLTEVNVPLSLQDVGGFENEWKFDCSLMRYFVFALQEPLIRTTFPN